MTANLNTSRAQLLAMLAIAAAVAAAFWISEGAGHGLLAGAWMLLFVAIIHFGRSRFDAIDVMSGTGDERARSLYVRTVAFTGNVIVYVVLGWWLVTVIKGDPNQTLTIIATVGGLAFIVGAIVNSSRG